MAKANRQNRKVRYLCLVSVVVHHLLMLICTNKHCDFQLQAGGHVDTIANFYEHKLDYAVVHKGGVRTPR
jgi:hypothetical protein